jgi:hypothetical protein
MSRQLGLLSACCLAFAMMASSAMAAPKAGSEDAVCGGAAGKCSSGLVCEMPAGQCQMPDATGVCKAKRGVCYGVSKPVCGCDGKTYQSDCRAHEAGINVLAAGVCPKK